MSGGWDNNTAAGSVPAPLWQTGDGSGDYGVAAAVYADVGPFLLSPAAVIGDTLELVFAAPHYASTSAGCAIKLGFSVNGADVTPAPQDVAETFSNNAWTRDLIARWFHVVTSADLAAGVVPCRPRFMTDGTLSTTAYVRNTAVYTPVFSVTNWRQ